jgi:asparagine synthase (glutamine-hydrolysing)
MSGATPNLAQQKIHIMCGIFALLLNRPLNDADIEIGRAGTVALRHRGPDGTGEWIDREAGVYIGHRRLAIIDPTAASDQPMAREGQVLAFNGEIYNFRDLRRDLTGRGDKFTSTGDTEVLLAAWRRWGSGCMDHLDGMFAFLVWDRTASTAHLAVDPFGEKPLLWAETRDGIYVSSELGPLVDALKVQPHLSDEMVAAYFGLGFIAAPATAYPAIKRLPAAGRVDIRGGRATPITRYWEPPIAEPGRRSVRELTETELTRIAEAIAGSLARRLIADVPLAAFLSAGVDSALVVAMAARDLGVKLNALTASFTGQELPDEAPRARQIAEALGVNHEVLVSGRSGAKSDATELLALYRQPTENIGIFPILEISRAAAAQYTVVVTGLAGDEVFWGYGKHAAFYRRRALYALPERGRIAIGWFVRFLSEFIASAENFERLFAVHDWERYLAQKNNPAFPWLCRLPQFADWAQRTFANGIDRFELAVPRFELREVMPNAHLVASDLGSMRASVELRTPFLSRNLVETVAQLDPRSLLAFGQKSVLRRLLARYLPHDLVDYPKSGFRFPARRFLDASRLYPGALPNIPRVRVEEAWRRRHEPKGWANLAVGLVVLSTFVNDNGGIEA